MSLVKSPQEKAEELVDRFFSINDLGVGNKATNPFISRDYAKQCAIICVEIEYHTAREILFNVRASAMIENEKIYLSRIQELIGLEKEVKQEIEKL